MASSKLMNCAIILIFCTNGLLAQSDFDPETGLPIEPVKTVQYDPVTGAPLDIVDDSAPIDPETGLPLRSAPTSEPPKLKAEKLIPAQLVAPGVVPVVRRTMSDWRKMTSLAQSDARAHNPAKAWILPAGMANIGGMDVGAFTGTIILGALTEGYFLGFLAGGVAGAVMVSNSLANTVKFAPVPEHIAAQTEADVATYQQAYIKEAKRLRVKAAWSGTAMVTVYTVGAMFLFGLLMN